ncbi:MAG: hypothetical protein M3Q27_05620 [Actinomycetota bacterium]|nr:hypothetical protein [Actinomycetota bacterium]
MRRKLARAGAILVGAFLALVLGGPRIGPIEMVILFGAVIGRLYLVFRPRGRA